MLEYKILQFGCLLHLAIQLYNGFKTKKMKPNKNYLWTSIFIFTLIGSILTIINLYSIEDFGESGTKRFNPLIIITFYGCFLNIAVYPIGYTILAILQKIKTNKTKSTSM